MENLSESDQSITLESSRKNPIPQYYCRNEKASYSINKFPIATTKPTSLQKLLSDNFAMGKFHDWSSVALRFLPPLRVGIKAG